MKKLPTPIPVLVCHQHFLCDVGTDLLREGHDKLHDLFCRIDVRKDLRAFVRKLAQRLGKRIHQAHMDIRSWQDNPAQNLELPEGAAGIAAVRALRAYAMTLKSPKHTGPWTALSPDSGSRAGCIVETGYP